MEHATLYARNYVEIKTLDTRLRSYLLGKKEYCDVKHILEK